MTRMVAAALLAALLVSCGGGRRPQTTRALRYSGFQRTSVDPTFLEGLGNLGDRCYQAGQASAIPATDDPGFLQNTGSAEAELRAVSLLESGGSSQASQTSPETSRRRVIHDLEQLAYLDDIEVAQYRATKSELVIIGPPARGAVGIRPDDFLVVFRALSGGAVPGVSIDPAASTRIMKVRYFGQVEHTHLGLSLFEADRLLKLMSTGFDNQDCSRWSGMPPNMPTELELFSNGVRTNGEGGVGQAQWHRFWFEFNENPVERDNEKLAIRIPATRLAVNEQSVPAGYRSPASARQFAATLSDRFMELKGVIPSFADVHRAAGLTSLAKWVIDQHIPVERDWLSSPPEATSTPESTPRVSVTRSTLDGDHFVQVGIEGGVDFQKPNIYRIDDGYVSAVLHAAEIASHPKESTWDFTAGGKAYRAVRLSYRHPVNLRSEVVEWYRTVSGSIPTPHIVDRRVPHSTLGITNKTAGSLSVGLEGPTRNLSTIAAGSTRDIDLLPGSYTVSATSTCGTLNDALSVQHRESYTASYYCEAYPPTPPPPQPKPEPPPQTAKLTIQNQTGAAITIQITGSMSNAYSAPVGSSTIDVLPGYYNIKASSVCGSRVDSVSISPRGTAVETYTCVQGP